MKRLLIGILILLILLAGIGGVVWWKISELKKNLVRDLGTALGAKVEVASFSFDPWHREIRATGISLINERPGAPWEKGDISQASIRFRLRKLFAPTMPIQVEVSSWSVVLHSTPPGASASTETPTGDETAPPPTAPETLRVVHLSARQGEVQIHLANDRQVTLHNVDFEALNNNAGTWITHLKTASIQAGSLETGPGSVQLRSDREKITLSQLRLQCDPGMITGEGEISLADKHAIHLTLKATQVPVTMLVGLQWRMKMSGLVTGDLTFAGDDQTGTARGQLSVSAGKFNVLPWLGKVTALVNLPDISNVEVDQATTDYEWKDGTLHLTNLDVRKNDVTRIAGKVDIDPQGQVDGQLKLGLPSTVTARWPKLQEKVFSTQLDNYNWADVHLIGPADHLQEDLTPRLLAAGAEEGGNLLNQGAQKAYDVLKDFLK